MPRKKTSATKEPGTAQSAHRAKEAGKQAHYLTQKTRKVYGRHVRQGRKWMASLFTKEGNLKFPSHPEDGTQIYHDPKFKDAFANVLNHCSDQALDLYLLHIGFVNGCTISTIEGVRAAFKRLWKEASVSWSCLQKGEENTDENKPS